MDNAYGINIEVV